MLLKYDREILGLLELIENIFEFAPKINYSWSCIPRRHIFVPITNIIYDIILINMLLKRIISGNLSYNF